MRERKIYVVTINQGYADMPLYYVKCSFERREDAEAYVAEHETYISGITRKPMTDAQIEEVILYGAKED